MYLIMNGVTTECFVSSCRIFFLKQMEKNWSVRRFKISELAGYFFVFCYSRIFSML